MIEENMGSEKRSSVVVCPICGGPTHLSRDTGDFTCDHCGKIVVRAMRKNWVGSVLDSTSNFIDSVRILTAAVNYRPLFTKFVGDATKKGWDYKNVQGTHRFIYKGAPTGTKISDKVIDVKPTNEAGVSFFDNPAWKIDLYGKMSRIENMHGSFLTPNAEAPSHEAIWGAKEEAPEAQQKSNNGYTLTRELNRPTTAPTTEKVDQPGEKAESYYQFAVPQQPSSPVNSPQNYGFYPKFNLTENTPAAKEPTQENEPASEALAETPLDKVKRNYVKGYQHGRSTGLSYHHNPNNIEYDNEPCDYCIVGDRLQKDIKNDAAGKKLRSPRTNIVQKIHKILTTSHEDQEDPQAFVNVLDSWNSLPTGRRDQYRSGAKFLSLSPITATKQQVNHFFVFLANKLDEFYL